MYIEKGNQSHLSRFVFLGGWCSPVLLVPALLEFLWPYRGTTFQNFRERCLGYAVLNYPMLWSARCVCSRAHCLKRIHSIWVIH